VCSHVHGCCHAWHTYNPIELHATTIKHLHRTAHEVPAGQLSSVCKRGALQEPLLSPAALQIPQQHQLAGVLRCEVQSGVTTPKLLTQRITPASTTAITHQIVALAI